jgi:putative transposase
MRVAQAYRFELDPNDITAGALASHVGADRFAYNWGLALVKARLGQRARVVERSLVEGLSTREAAAAGNTVVVPWTLASLRKEWNAAKAVAAPWWGENSKEAYSSGLDRLARALQAFSDSRSGRRKGPVVGFPRFRKRGGRASVAFTTGAIAVLDGRHVRLPRLGVIRTKEATAKLANHLDVGAAHIRRATVSARGGRWYVSFGVEADRADPVTADPASVVGVDIGVTHLAVLSTGEMVPNPKPLSRYARRLARLSAQLARQHKGSGRRAKTKARIARCHATVADLRVDGLHKLTTRLATTYGTIVVEDLNVAGMTRRPKPVADPDRRGGYLPNGGAAKAGLNRAVLDAAPAELARQLAYKCSWYGARLVTAGRFYPSSKTCSVCGTVKAKLSLAERTFDCERCGVVIDRDLNAAVNLAALAAGVPTVAGSGPETQNARTGTLPPREAGTGQPGKTGPASPEEAPRSVLIGCDK